MLPFSDGRFDAAVAGLALNFVPDPLVAVLEMRRVARPRVAAYVVEVRAIDEPTVFRDFDDLREPFGGQGVRAIHTAAR